MVKSTRSKVSKEKIPQKNHLRPHKKLKLTLIILAAYLLSLFVPLISPYTKFPLYVVKCGGWPLSATEFMANSTYRTPKDDLYSYLNPFVADYFCTPEEAKENHFYPPSRL